MRRDFAPARGKKTISKNAVMEVLKQSATEFGEESVSEIVNTLADLAVMADDSEYKRYEKELIENGQSKNEAAINTFKQYFLINTFMSGLGGAVSGGVLGGPAVAAGSSYTKNLGKSLGQESVSELIGLGLANDTKSESHRMAALARERISKEPGEQGRREATFPRSGNSEKEPGEQGRREATFPRSGNSEKEPGEQGRREAAFPRSGNSEKGEKLSDGDIGSIFIQLAAEEEQKKAGRGSKETDRAVKAAERRLLLSGLEDGDRKSIVQAYAGYAGTARKNGVNPAKAFDAVNSLQQADRRSLQKVFGKPVDINGKLYSQLSQVITKPDAVITDDYVMNYADEWVNMLEKSNGMIYRVVKTELTDKGYKRDDINKMLADSVVNGLVVNGLVVNGGGGTTGSGIFSEKAAAVIRKTSEDFNIFLSKNISEVAQVHSEIWGDESKLRNQTFIDITSGITMPRNLKYINKNSTSINNILTGRDIVSKEPGEQGRRKAPFPRSGNSDNRVLQMQHKSFSKAVDELLYFNKNKSQTAVNQGIQFPNIIPDGFVNSIRQNNDSSNGSVLQNVGKNTGYFELGDTPEVLQKLGAKNLPMVMTKEVMAKITGEKHSIVLDEVKNLPEMIADPVLVLNSSTYPNAFVVLTEIGDKNGNDALVIIHLNKIENRLKVSRIASAYDKNNISKYIDTEIGKGNLRYVNKQKSQIWSTSRGFQLPNLDTILTERDIVNKEPGEQGRREALFPRSGNSEGSVLQRYNKDTGYSMAKPGIFSEQVDKRLRGEMNGDKNTYLASAKNAETLKNQGLFAENGNNHTNLIPTDNKMSMEAKNTWPPKGENISPEQYKELMQYAGERKIMLEGFKEFDGDIELIKQALDDITNILNEYPKTMPKGNRNLLSLGVSYRIPDDDFAQTRGKNITINGNAFRSKEALIDEYAKLADVGFFAKGTTYRGIIKHELGHFVHNVYKINYRKILEEIFNTDNTGEILERGEVELSTYGFIYSDFREVISEVFNEVYDSEQPREFAVTFKEKVDKLIKQR